MYPSKMTPGARHRELATLALRAAMVGRSKRSLSLYDPHPYGYSGYQSLHPVYLEVRSILMERLVLSSEFDFERAAMLMDRHPATFSESEFNLAVRALWKSDRVGFHKGGDAAFRDGFIPALIRHWDDPIHAAQSV